MRRRWHHGEFCAISWGQSDVGDTEIGQQSQLVASMTRQGGQSRQSAESIVAVRVTELESISERGLVAEDADAAARAATASVVSS